MDLLAVPDFFGGAMENWGLITFFEFTLLYNETSNSSPWWAKQLVAFIVAHEEAHQWFGDIVTLEWWSDVFLNEGFASYMEGRGMARVLNDSNSNIFTYADWWDSLKERLSIARPIHYELEAPGDYTVIFDYVTYEKAGSIIHMLEMQMGSVNFYAGIRNYLNKHLYSNTNYHSLLDALSAVTSINAATSIGDGNELSVADFAEGWLTQAGHPLVFVKRLNATSLEITTKGRFVVDRATAAAGQSFNDRWWIPVKYSVNGVNMEEKLLYDSLILSVPESLLFVLNVDAANGPFYRVLYDDPLYNRIADQLAANHSVIAESVATRFVDDAFRLGEGNYTSYMSALELVDSYLVKEDRWGPVRALLDNLDYIYGIFGTQPERQYIEEYTTWFIDQLFANSEYGGRIRNQLSELVKTDEQRQLIWARTGKNTAQRFGRSTKANAGDLVKILSNYADGFSSQEDADLRAFHDLFLVPCRNVSSDESALAMSSQCSRVTLEDRPRVYATGVEHGTQSVFDFVKSLYAMERDLDERHSLVRALAFVRDEFALRLLLRAAIRDDDPYLSVPFTDGIVYLYYLIAVYNELGKKLVSSFFIDNADAIIQRYNADFYINYLIQASFPDYSLAGISQLESFINSRRELTGLFRGFADQLAILRHKRWWLDTNFSWLTQWFAKANKAHRDQKGNSG